jgi:hypothetical protein
MAYFKKNLRPNSPALGFIAFHDFTTRASCSSLNPLPSKSKLFMLFRRTIDGRLAGEFENGDYYGMGCGPILDGGLA